MELFATTKAEMESIVARRRISTDLVKAVPPAADRVYEVGENISVHCKKKKAWEGPMLVTNVVDKIVSIQDIKDDYRGDFSKHQIKPYVRDLPETDANTVFVEMLHGAISPFVSDKRENTAPGYNVHILEIIDNNELVHPCTKKLNKWRWNASSEERGK